MASNNPEDLFAEDDEEENSISDFLVIGMPEEDQNFDSDDPTFDENATNSLFADHKISAAFAAEEEEDDLETNETDHNVVNISSSSDHNNYSNDQSLVQPKKKRRRNQDLIDYNEENSGKGGNFDAISLIKTF